jgi:uncharacterized protein YqeY
MSLHDRLTEDLKLAMKARDQLRMDVIRMIKAAVMNREMEQEGSRRCRNEPRDDDHDQATPGIGRAI